jgi:hypothetical protein
LQLVLVVIVIFVPQTVTVFLDAEHKVDIDKMRIEVPAETPGADGPPLEGDAAANANSEGAGKDKGGADSDEDDPGKALERALRGGSKK